VAANNGSGLGRTDLIVFGKELVIKRLEHLGCAVIRARNPRDGRLQVRTTSGRVLEVFVSTQRVGGYVFWTKRRLQPARTRFATVVLIEDDIEAALYLVPSVDWLNASPPLTDRDYIGMASEPEYGIEIGRSAVRALQRYKWSDAAAKLHFG
jgi:hypothetical protein